MIKLLKSEYNYYLFEDLHKSKKRLNIVAHGVEIYGVIYIRLGRAPSNAEQLYNLINTTCITRQYSYIRVLSCGSAHGNVNSIVCSLSRLLPGTFVKGYLDDIRGNFPSECIFDYVNEYGIVEARRDFLGSNEVYRLDKNYNDFGSVTYRNGYVIKESSII